MFKGIFERTVSKAPLPYSANNARKSLDAGEILKVATLIEVAAAGGKDSISVEILRNATIDYLRKQGFQVSHLICGFKPPVTMISWK